MVACEMTNFSNDKLHEMLMCAKEVRTYTSRSASWDLSFNIEIIK